MTQVEQVDSISDADQTISADGTFSQVVEARGAKMLAGIIDKPSSYTLNLVWLENDGTEIVSQTLTTGQTGQFEFDKPMYCANKCRVEVKDTSSTEETAGISVQLV